MLKKSISVTLFFMGFGMLSSAIAQEDCVAAVDAADTMNVNQKLCDYSDKGLNGLLHKTFVKKSAENMESASPLGAQKKSLSFVVRSQTDQWTHVQQAKTQLLPQALARCDNGFRVIAEEYRPLAMGKIELRLQCVCL